MTNSDRDLELIEENFRDIALLESIASTLGWDERTGLPDEAGEYRAHQITLLSGLIHDRRTSPQLGERLARLADSSVTTDPNSNQSVTIRCLQKDFLRHSKLSKSLVEAISNATVRGEQAWAVARPKNDFASFLPFLENILALRKEEAAMLQVGNQTLYDALMDQYEEGATVAIIGPVLNNLRQQLVPLVQRCAEAKNRPDGATLSRSFDIDQQRKLSRWIASKIGYQFSQGRLDETDHPFCTSLGPYDHRILTRYDANHFNSGFFGTLHEAGHAMYEQGLPKDAFGMPLGTAVSLGIHESQSRLWENMIGRSHAFWSWCFSEVQKYFPGTLDDVSGDTFFRDINRVEPSLIRVDADEVTYNLHILIRFELEQALLSGDLQATNLPEAWREKYTKYLGVAPTNDHDGVLQDVHWSAGLIGYFPTYALGNIYAAQLMDAAREQIEIVGNEGLDVQIRRGEFSPLLEWLRTNVHRYGRQMNPRALVEKATSKAFSAAPLVKYLSEKIEHVYG